MVGWGQFFTLKYIEHIKVLRPELVSRQDIRHRFTREAVSMAQLSHPNLVRIFDYGQEALTMYIVMEYLPGNSLQSYFNRVGTLDYGQSLEICLQVAKRLKFIHQKV